MLITIGQRADHGFDEPLGLLGDCHRRIEHFLATLVTITHAFQGGVLDAPNRQAFDAALRYFDTAAPRHSADEEDSLFPRMLQAADRAAHAVGDTLRRLEADHRLAEQHHEAVSRLGARWLAEETLAEAETRVLAEHLAVLDHLYRDHIAVEDQEIFPVAGRVLGPETLEAIGREMAARRGRPFRHEAFPPHVAAFPNVAARASQSVVTQTDSPSAAEALAQFDRLGVDEGVEFVSSRSLSLVLEALQAHHADRFEWNVLESGPHRFRVEVRRCATPRRTVSEVLSVDHGRLDDILPTVLELVDRHDFPAALARFSDFACGLDHHIDAEERVLFPAFADRTGMRSGPTVVMRAEHVEIRRGMAQVRARLEAGDASGTREMLNRLTATLSVHNVKEESMLYPMTDRALDQSDRETILKQMQAL